MKLLTGIIGGLVLYTASMINGRGPEITGTCVVDGFEIYPVINHDCKGTFYER